VALNRTDGGHECLPELGVPSQKLGEGQAEALFLFIMIAAVTGVQLYFSKKLEVEG
jgi:ABC-type sugar transport system permease subunit